MPVLRPHRCPIQAPRHVVIRGCLTDSQAPETLLHSNIMECAFWILVVGTWGVSSVGLRSFATLSKPMHSFWRAPVGLAHSEAKQLISFSDGTPTGSAAGHLPVTMLSKAILAPLLACSSLWLAHGFAPAAHVKGHGFGRGQSLAASHDNEQVSRYPVSECSDARETTSPIWSQKNI